MAEFITKIHELPIASDRAKADIAGNSIVDTYATKSDLEETRAVHTSLLDEQTERAEQWSLKDSALNYDYLIVDYLTGSNNPIRIKLHISSIHTGDKLSENCFASYTPEQYTIGWIGNWSWYFTDDGNTLKVNYCSFRLSDDGVIEYGQKNPNGSRPLIKSLIGVKLPQPRT